MPEPEPEPEMVRAAEEKGIAKRARQGTSLALACQLGPMPVWTFIPPITWSVPVAPMYRSVGCGGFPLYIDVKGMGNYCIFIRFELDSVRWVAREFQL